MSKPFNIHDWQAKRRLVEQDEFQKRQDALTPGKNPDYFYDDDSLMSKMKSQESMSNATIKALQVAVSDYSLNTILTELAVIVDKVGKHDEADMIKNLASKLDVVGDPRMDPAIRSDFDDPVMDEQNTTGTGASFSAGNSPAYATPKAFGKKKDKDIEVLGYKKI
jgi:hypothetical protein